MDIDSEADGIGFNSPALQHPFCIGDYVFLMSASASPASVGLALLISVFLNPIQILRDTLPVILSFPHSVFLWTTESFP